MANNRDDFSKNTKNALALRAGYVCSMEGCGKPTVGPSDESPSAVMQIGIAAHICAAAPGPGARRYDLNMTPEERADISNGIWLCSNCATMIDRDAATYTVEKLRNIKRRHEASCRVDPNRGSTDDFGDIIAIGPNIIGVGVIVGSGDARFRVRLKHFVIGTGNDLITFASDFSRVPPQDRYVLLNELGHGRTLSASPEVTKNGNDYEVQLAVGGGASRLGFDAIGATMCRETGQILTGVDAFVQNVECLLGLAMGEAMFAPLIGTHISQFFKDYAGTPWLSRFIKMEIIRLASIPIEDRLSRTNMTPLRCVNRVGAVEIPSEELKNQRLSVSICLDLESLGAWSGVVAVFIHTPEQLEASKNRAAYLGSLGLVD